MVIQVFGPHERPHRSSPEKLKGELCEKISMLSLYLIVKLILKSLRFKPHLHASSIAFTISSRFLNESTVEFYRLNI